MPIASLNQHPDTMPDLGIRILLSEMLTQMVGLLERDILDDHNIREGRQAIEYELMPFYRELPRDYNWFDSQPLQWWRSLQSVLMTPWMNLRFELLDSQGVWQAMVEAGSLEEHDLQSVYRVAEISENRDTLAEARLPLINTFDALMERAFYQSLMIPAFEDPLDDQLFDLGGFGIPVDFVLDETDFGLLKPPSASKGELEDDDENSDEAFNESVISDADLDLLEQALQDADDDGSDPFAEGQGLAVEDPDASDDLEDVDDDDDERATDRWEHQQELLLELSNSPPREVGAMIDESVFQRWQVELLRQVQSWLIQMDDALEGPMEYRINAVTRLTMGFHPYAEQGVSNLFHSMRIQLAALAIVSNGDLEPFDEVDRQQRGERLLEVIEDEMFLRLMAYMGGPVYRMGLTEMDPTLIADGGVSRH